MTELPLLSQGHIWPQPQESPPSSEDILLTGTGHQLLRPDTTV